MKYGSEVKAVGTVHTGFIEFFPTEFDAFKAFADTYPDSVSLLLDTYNIMESGLPNLIKLDDYLIEKYPNDPNRRVKSARIDSGDLARGSKRLRKALDAAGKPISSWWLPMALTSGRSPTWSFMSTLILIPTAWAKISSPPLLTLCSAACINWWRSSCRMAPISPR